MMRLALLTLAVLAAIGGSVAAVGVLTAQPAAACPQTTTGS